MHHSTLAPFGSATRRVCATLLFFAAACEGPPRVDTEAAIDAAVGVGSALEFREEGAPLDEAVIAPDERLTLEDAVRRAVVSDPGLQGALARVRGALAEAEQARLLPDPVLSLVLRFGNGQPQFDADLGEGIVRVLTRGARTSAADNRLRAAAADAVTVAVDLLLELQTTYASAVASDALVPLLENRLTLMQQELDLLRARASSGETAPADVVAFDTERLEVVIELEAARREQSENRLHLARLVGEPSASATWPLVDPARAPATVRPVEECIREALQRRSEMQSARWELAALGDEASVAHWDPLADAEAGVSLQHEGSRYVGPSVSVPLPLFDTGSAREHLAEARRIEARHRAAGLARRIVEEVRAAALSLQAASTSLARVENELLPRQRERREQADAAYRAGQSDLTPLLLAESELRAAEAKAIQFRQQEVIARCKLRRAIGGAEPDDPTANPQSREVR